MPFGLRCNRPGQTTLGSDWLGLPRGGAGQCPQIWAGMEPSRRTGPVAPNRTRRAEQDPPRRTGPVAGARRRRTTSWARGGRFRTRRGRTAAAHDQLGQGWKVQGAPRAHNGCILRLRGRVDPQARGFWPEFFRFADVQPPKTAPDANCWRWDCVGRHCGATKQYQPLKYW